MRSIEETMNTQEDLHRDLKKFLEKANFGQSLKHPLVFAVPYFEQMNAYYNEQYRYKRKLLKDFFKEKKWGGYIFLHERPHRMEALLKIMDKMSDKEYWEMLGSIWVNSENLWQIEFLPLLLNCDRPHREKMMEEEEQALLASLPDEIKVFRGHQKINRNGYSWTLSFWRAKWFAQRFGKKNRICGSRHLQEKRRSGSIYWS